MSQREISTVKTSKIVFEIFKELVAEKKQSLLIVTHDEDFARTTDRNIVMDDGRMVK